MATYPEASVSGSTSRTSFLNAFKLDYLPELDSWFHKDMGKLAPLIYKEAGQMGGVKSVAFTFTGAPQSVGHRTEDDAFPTPRSSTSENPELISRRIDYRLRFTLESRMSARKGKSVAWREPTEAEIKLAEEQLKINVTKNGYLGNYDVMGNVLASAASVLTMQSRDSVNYSATGWFNQGAFYMRVGQSLQMIDYSAGGRMSSASITEFNKGTTGGATGSGLQVAANGSAELYITAVDRTNPAAETITLSANPAGAAGTGWTAAAAVNDILIPYGSRFDATDTVFPYNAVPSSYANAIGYYKAFNGLGNSNTDSTFYPAYLGLTKSSIPGAMGIAQHNNGVPIPFTERQLEFLVGTMQEVSGEAAEKLVLGIPTFREVTKENRALRHFAPVLGQSGQKNMAFIQDDLTLKYITDWLCPMGSIFALTPADYKWFSMMKLGSPDEGDAMRYVQNKANHEVIALKMGNGMCTGPWRNGIRADIQCSSVGLI